MRSVLLASSGAYLLYSVLVHTRLLSIADDALIGALMWVATKVEGRMG